MLMLESLPSPPTRRHSPSRLNHSSSSPEMLAKTAFEANRFYRIAGLS